MITYKRLHLLVAMLLAGALLAAACGGDDSESSSGDSESTSGDSESTSGGDDSGGESQDSDTGDGDADTEEAVTISFWKGPHSARDIELIRPIIDEFESQHPNIQIEHTVTPWDTYVDAFTAAFGGGNPPCVSYQVDYLSAPYAFTGQFVDLDAAGYSDDVRGDYPTLWDKGQIGGVQVGVPYATDGRMFMYNKDLFDQAGVAYPEADWTQDDFHQIVRDLKAGGVDIPFGLDMTYAGFGYQNFLPFLFNNGGRIMSEDGSTPVVNSPEHLEALEFTLSLIDEGLAPPFGQYNLFELEDLMMRGGLGIYNMRGLTLATIANEFSELNFGVVQPPVGAAGTQTNFQDWGFFTLSEDCPHKAQAWEWLKFYTNAENTADYLGEVVLAPARLDTGLMEDDPNANAYLINAQYNRTLPISANTLEIVESWWIEVESAALGAVSAEQALNNAQSVLEGITGG